MSTFIARFKWDINLIGVFDPRGSSDHDQTADIDLFVDQVANMAPAFGPQVVRENIHTCLRGIALKWYKLPEV